MRFPWSRNKHNPEAMKNFLNFFHIEVDGKAGTTINVDIDQKMLAYLSNIKGFIQRGFITNGFSNYATIILWIAGQKVDISFIKEGGMTPSELCTKLKLENRELAERVSALEADLSGNKALLDTANKMLGTAKVVNILNDIPKVYNDIN